ncbi:sensor histidine kinase [Gordonia sp. (in: high G+C Gram-positive bacteria)]|uniref:sensor histidine kinase n=1 Tax=Gordonia sp. (in: high G+C Gram-positive bacteria) TaxID=84139 RepID=UPI0039E5359E
MTVAWIVAAIALAIVCGVGIGRLLFGQPAFLFDEPITPLSVLPSAPPAPEGLTPQDRSDILRMIVRRSEHGVVVIEESGDVALYNEAAVKLGLIADNELRPQVVEEAEEVLRTGEDRRFEFVPPTPTAGFLATARATAAQPVLSVRCLARYVERAGMRFILIFGDDDSENVRVEATRRDFVANVSHELKTPVGAIGLLAEALLESADDPESVRHFGSRIVSESKRMGNLVTELISLSRLQGGETAELQPVDVDGLVDEAISVAQIPAEAATITLNSDEPSGLVVHGDRPLLLTALNNLLSNAIAYSPEGTVVSVSRRVIEPEGPDEGPPMVALAVTDRGIGIAQADQERVFERFFRVDKARSRLTGGTGLGLAIVKHVAANHSGSISVWSRPGTGSTFTLAIPQAPVDDAPSTQVPDQQTTEQVEEEVS